MKPAECRLLSCAAVVRVHDRLIEEFGGAPGIRDEALLDASLGRASSGFGSFEAYPSLFLKAAATAHSIAINQPFMDGNKRTALAVALTVLRLNGVEVQATEQEEEHVIMALVAGEISVADLAEWLEVHGSPLDLQ